MFFGKTRQISLQFPKAVVAEKAASTSIDKQKVAMKRLWELIVQAIFVLTVSFAATPSCMAGGTGEMLPAGIPGFSFLEMSAEDFDAYLFQRNKEKTAHDLHFDFFHDSIYCYYQNREYERAIDSIWQWHKLMIHAGDTNSLAFLSINFDLGMIFWGMGKMELAENFFHICVKYQSRPTLKTTRLRATAYKALSNLARANLFIRKAEKYALFGNGGYFDFMITIPVNKDPDKRSSKAYNKFDLNEENRIRTEIVTAEIEVINSLIKKFDARFLCKKKELLLIRHKLQRQIANSGGPRITSKQQEEHIDSLANSLKNGFEYDQALTSCVTTMAALYTLSYRHKKAKKLFQLLDSARSAVPEREYFFLYGKHKNYGLLMPKAYEMFMSVEMNPTLETLEKWKKINFELWYEKLEEFSLVPFEVLNGILISYQVVSESYDVTDSVFHYLDVIANRHISLFNSTLNMEEIMYASNNLEVSAATTLFECEKAFKQAHEQNEKKKVIAKTMRFWEIYRNQTMRRAIGETKVTFPQSYGPLASGNPRPN